jgi:WhiB family redox-sensing transcriptional regulator
MRPDIYEQAKCRGLNPRVFFPERGESTAQALAVCAECPIRVLCLEENLGERAGVWGGMTGRQRKRLRVRRGRGEPVEIRGALRVY